MTPLELLALILSPFTLLGIYAHRARLLKIFKASLRKVEEWTRPEKKEPRNDR